jgi:uncharacterized protein
LGERLRYDQLNLPESCLKLHTDTNSALNTVTGYGDGFVEINQTRFNHAIAFGPLGAVEHWQAAAATDITTDLLLQAAKLRIAPLDPMAFLDATESNGLRLEGIRPEVLLVGTGNRQCMLSHTILLPLLQAGVGVECMSTQAAARTYNILMAEGRQVIAALLPENTI